MSSEKNRQRKEMYRASEYIAKNIRLLRYMTGRKQEDVAGMLHMSRTAYSHLEGGLMTPDLTTICELSNFYGINLDYLISFDIADHILSLLRDDTSETDAYCFIEKYINLSSGAKKHIRERISALSADEKHCNHFPWKYGNEYGDKK